MKKYQQLIDQQTWAFINKTYACYPENTVTLSLIEQRAIYDTMCAEFFAGYPAGVSARDEAIRAVDHAIPVRHYASAQPDQRAQILYFHGGGFVVGGLHSHDDVCAEFCAATGFSLTSVDYRLAPEHVYPAALEDALTAYDAVCAQSEPAIILAGDSAGGTLAAQVAHARRRAPRPPLAQLLIYPWLGNGFDRASYREHAEAPMLTTADVKAYGKLLFADNSSETPQPWAAPLDDQDFSDLPPTYLFTAQCDPLCDDGADYHRQLQAAGIASQYVCEPGLVHGYLRARHSVQRAADSVARMVTALRAAGQRA